jgi:uncharacterized damage-inducible protein DinB
MQPATLAGHFAMLARYNTMANQRLYAACAELSDAEYRRERSASFGSIHRTLNHILLGDRIWMARFIDPAISTTPPLGAELYSDFASLRDAREREDARLQEFMGALNESLLQREISYVNNAGKPCNDPAALIFAHLFNHQTHHRAQIQMMLRETPAELPSLDMHRVIRP